MPLFFDLNLESNKKLVNSSHYYSFLSPLEQLKLLSISLEKQVYSLSLFRTFVLLFLFFSFLAY